MEPQAKQRKRDAVGNLRALADELGVTTNRKKADLTKSDFVELHANVARHSSTPEHKGRLDAAMQLYIGTRISTRTRTSASTRTNTRISCWAPRLETGLQYNASVQLQVPMATPPGPPPPRSFLYF